MAQNTPQLDIGTYTDVGQIRSRNEDSLRIFPEPHPGGQLFIVADGVGGENYGQEASQLAVQRIGNLYYQYYEQYPNQSIEHILKQVIAQVNVEIYEAALRMGSAGHMGTTAVVAVIRNRILTVAWVGDSRVYVVSHKKGLARQITIDHSQVEDDIRAGVLTREEAEHHPERNVLSRSLGGNPQVEADTITGELEDHDLVVLCSDGLTRYIDKTLIAQHVLYHPTSQVSADTLGDMANKAGGKDNISVIVVHLGKRATEVETIMPLSPPPPAPPYNPSVQPSTGSGVIPGASVQDTNLAQPQERPFWQNRAIQIGLVAVAVIILFTAILLGLTNTNRNNTVLTQTAETQTVELQSTQTANLVMQVEQGIQGTQSSITNLTGTALASTQTALASTQTQEAFVKLSQATETPTTQVTETPTITATEMPSLAPGEITVGTVLYTQRDTYLGVSAGAETIPIQTNTQVIVVDNTYQGVTSHEFNGYYHVESTHLGTSGWVLGSDLGLNPSGTVQHVVPAMENMGTAQGIPEHAPFPPDTQLYISALNQPGESVYLQPDAHMSTNQSTVLHHGDSVTIIGDPRYETFTDGSGQWWWFIRLASGETGYIEQGYLIPGQP